MKTILATAYAVNPFKGSEDGMGWNFIYQIARYHKIIAITRKNNRTAIEKYMIENPDHLYDNITFLYYDLPYWVRFWKKGSRGALLYFYLWQFFVPYFIKKQKLDFNITHNLNFHNDWTPSFLWKLNKPFVWGPIGHHPMIPSSFFKPYNKRYYIKDKATYLAKLVFWKLSWSLNKTKTEASHILCMNSSVQEQLNIPATKMSIIPSVASEDLQTGPYQKNNSFQLISVGRLVPLKGFDLTIQAFSQFIQKLPEDQKRICRLVIVGSGPEETTYKQMAKELELDAYIEFISWINRKDLMSLYKASNAFIFPSHEGAGMVVAEALSFGLPVLCLDNCGPGEFITKECGISVKANSYNKTIHGISDSISKLYNQPGLLDNMSKNARKHFENYFHWDKRGEQFRQIYLTV